MWTGNSNVSPATFSFVDDNPNTCAFTFTLGPVNGVGTVSDNGLDSEGTWTVTEVTPEPGTAVLLLMGIVLMILTLKRIDQGLPRAS
jgi:hypothetical protein